MSIKTPVRVGGGFNNSIIDAEGDSIAFARTVHAREIALALNAHDALVEACELAQAELRRHGVGIAKISDALALVRERGTDEPDDNQAAGATAG